MNRRDVYNNQTDLHLYEITKLQSELMKRRMERNYDEVDLLEQRIDELQRHLMTPGG